MAHRSGAAVGGGVGICFVSHTCYTRLNVLYHTYASVMSNVLIRQIRMRYVTHMNALCRTDE